MTEHDDPEPDEQPPPPDAQASPPEVQRVGPPPSQPTRPAFGTRPWSSSRSDSSTARQGGLGVMPLVTIALVTAIISGSLSAAAVANLLRPPSHGRWPEATGLPGSPARSPGTRALTAARFL